MKLWLWGLVIVCATFVHIETRSYDEASSNHRIHIRGLDDVNVAASPAREGYDMNDETFKIKDVTLEGEYRWELLYYIDNLNNSKSQSQTLEKNLTVKTSYSDLSKSVYDASLKLSSSLEGGGKFEIISASVKHSIDVDLSTTYEQTIERKTNHEINSKFTRVFEVGPHSTGSMYRLIYRGPGVAYDTGTISTNGTFPIDKVFINCKVKQIPLLKDIQVVYTDQSIDMPEFLVTETFGTNPDINKGFKGSYVWLVPVWTGKVDEAVSSIQFVIQGESNDAYVDLAAGAGGSYRYLKMLRDRFVYTRIKKVGLLRSPKSKFIYGDRNEHGWEECTEDINQGRSGDFLHLCWNTVPV